MKESTKALLRAARFRQGNPPQKPMSEETKQKLREARKRQAPISTESREKIRQNNKNRKYKPHTEETKQKLSESLKKMWAERRKTLALKQSAVQEDKIPHCL